MGTVERAGDATSDVESGEEEEVVAGGERGAGIRNAMLGVLGGRGADSLVAELAALPAPVRRRVRALKALQRDAADIEAKFYTEVHQLECKYAALYKPLHDKRSEIVKGLHEPSDAECLTPWATETDGDAEAGAGAEGDEEQLARAVKGATITELDEHNQPINQPPKMDPNAKGIPEFWYTIFRNVSMLSDMMQEHDEPIIKSLEDIKVIMHEEPMGFTLEFHFAPNDYFTNTVLTKEYLMKCKPDEENPLEFEGPEIYQCRGCDINWKKGKNVTVKTIKKKQKHKSRGSVRTVTKSVQADSFFNFFNPPPMPDDNNSTLASDIQALLTTDFEIGHYIRERVVSRAVLLYTGEGLDDDDDYDDEEEMEEECSSEESEEEAPVHKKRGGGKRPGGGPPQPNPAECKQQ